MYRENLIQKPYTQRRSSVDLVPSWPTRRHARDFRVALHTTPCRYQLQSPPERKKVLKQRWNVIYLPAVVGLLTFIHCVICVVWWCYHYGNEFVTVSSRIQIPVSFFFQVTTLRLYFKQVVHTRASSTWQYNLIPVRSKGGGGSKSNHRSDARIALTMRHRLNCLDSSMGYVTFYLIQHFY